MSNLPPPSTPISPLLLTPPSPVQSTALSSSTTIIAPTSSSPKRDCCSICNEQLSIPRFDGKTEQAITLPCCHVFGSICIMRWLSESENQDCPNCRRRMEYACGHSILPLELEQFPAGEWPDACVVCRLDIDASVGENLLRGDRRVRASEKALRDLSEVLPAVLGGLFEGMCEEEIEERVEMVKADWKAELERLIRNMSGSSDLSEMLQD